MILYLAISLLLALVSGAVTDEIDASSERLLQLVVACALWPIALAIILGNTACVLFTRRK